MHQLRERMLQRHGQGGRVDIRFPCQPFSSKRKDRFVDDGPEHHKLYCVGEVLELLEQRLPNLAVLEKVPGFNKNSQGSEGPTPLHSFVQRLRDKGVWHVKVLTLSGHTWQEGFRGPRLCDCSHAAANAF